MITTGIIRQINISTSGYIGNKYLVELNIFQTAGNNNKKNYTYEANCCLPGGLYSAYNIGDMVYVGFINEDLSLPVILGKIYKGVEDQSRGYAQLVELKVDGNIQLSKNLNIGDITYEKLEHTVTQSFQCDSGIQSLKDSINEEIEKVSLYQHNIIAQFQDQLNNTYYINYSFQNNQEENYTSATLAKELFRLYGHNRIPILVGEYKSDQNSSIYDICTKNSSMIASEIILSDLPALYQLVVQNSGSQTTYIVNLTNMVDNVVAVSQ